MHPTTPLLAALAVAATTALLARPAPADAQSPCGGFSTVDTGDSLVEIAERCGVTLPALLAANPGVSDRTDLVVGGQLRIPDPAAAQPTPVEACGPVYRVRTGDTVAEIAEKCGLTIPLLVAANPPLPDPLGIHDGMGIRIPAVSRAAVEDPATVAVGEPLRAAIPAASAEPDSTSKSNSDSSSESDSDAAPEPADLVRVEGVLREGDRCAVVRTAGGEAVGVVGQIRQTFGPGDRVVLLGLPVAEHECATGRALRLRILYRADAPEGSSRACGFLATGRPPTSGPRPVRSPATGSRSSPRWPAAPSPAARP